jgi:hypothetical protein
LRHDITIALQSGLPASDALVQEHIAWALHTD